MSLWARQLQDHASVDAADGVQDAVSRQDQGAEDQQPGFVRREPPAERHGRGGVYGAGAAPGRNRFAPCLHCVHMSFNLVCNDFKFALSLDWVYISLCKPNKLCKLLMSKLCKPSLHKVHHKFTPCLHCLHQIYTGFQVTYQPGFFWAKHQF